MTAIEIELGQVQVAFNHFNAVLPDALQTPVSAPLAKVVVHRLPTDLLFVGSVRSGSIGI
jgi:hypothetical protein